MGVRTPSVRGMSINDLNIPEHIGRDHREAIRSVYYDGVWFHARVVFSYWLGHLFDHEEVIKNA